MRTFDSSHLPPTGLPFEFNEFKNRPLIDLEIGAGQGLHAVQYAIQNPERHLLAVEKTMDRFSKLSGRHARHPHLTNLTPLHADAVSFVCQHLPESCIDRVFLLYPNPYPKKAQSNLRWHNRPFIARLLEKLKPGAELVLATNIEDYAREAAASFVNSWNLRLLEFLPVPAGATPRTHFEKKYLLRGEKCWNLIFKT